MQYFYFCCYEGAAEDGLVLAQHPEAVHLQDNEQIRLPKFSKFILGRLGLCVNQKHFTFRGGSWFRRRSSRAPSS